MGNMVVECRTGSVQCNIWNQCVVWSTCSEEAVKLAMYHLISQVVTIFISVLYVCAKDMLHGLIFQEGQRSCSVLSWKMMFIHHFICVYKRNIMSSLERVSCNIYFAFVMCTGLNSLNMRQMRPSLVGERGGRM